MKRLNKKFYKQDALAVAPLLLGKILVRKLDNGKLLKYMITETEAYFGEEDSACHARVGKTNRTEVLYNEGGITYIYLCYGMYYLLNVVTGSINHPEAVLIRGVEGYNGPGKLTKAMDIGKDLNKEDLITSKEIWIEDAGLTPHYKTSKRVGIDYAKEPYKSIEWRFIMDDN
jgi:DNA-3-methyladenine glycosylase